jgi:hypothetical protein
MKEAVFPVRVFEWINSVASEHSCIIWSLDHESPTVHILDNKAFSELYGHDKTVWLRQFAVYGFKKIFHGQSHHQRRTCTLYTHPQFSPHAFVDMIKDIKRIASSNVPEQKMVNFEPSKILHQAVLKKNAFKKGELHIINDIEEFDEQFFDHVRIPMERKCSFDDYESQRHEMDLMNNDIISTTFHQCTIID